MMFINLKYQDYSISTGYFSIMYKKQQAYFGIIYSAQLVSVVQKGENHKELLQFKALLGFFFSAFPLTFVQPNQKLG